VIPAPTPEFSRTVRLDELRRLGTMTQELTTTAAERTALAERLMIPAVHDLRAEIRLVLLPDGAVALEGHIDAEVEQSCSVTLDPLKSVIASRFSVRYTSAQSDDASDAALGDDPDFLGEDIEPLPGDTIDIGEVTTQYLALELEPYPRAPGVDAAADGPESAEEENTPQRPNPFAVLKKLKDRG